MHQLLLDHLVPVFALVLLGRVLAGLKVVSEQQTLALSRFVFDIALPVLIARQMLHAELPPSIEWRLIIVYFGSAFAIFGLGALLGARLLGATGAAPAIHGITASFGNVLVLSVPITLGIYGHDAAVPLFLLIAFHSSTLFTLTTVVAELGIGAGGGELKRLPGAVLKGLVTNPILVALTTGLLLRHLPFAVPEMLDRSAALLGQAATPLALFALGANLARFVLGSLWRHALLLCVLKNLAFPALVWVVATWILPLGPMSRTVAIVTAAMPAGINAYLFASRYRVAVGEASATIVVSTILAFPILIWLTGMLPPP